MFYTIFIVLAFINLTLAAVFIKAPCPDVKAKENFRLDKYGSGTWNEVARYPNDIEKQGECPITVGTFENGRSKFKTTEIVDGEKVSIEGYYDIVPDASFSGVLSIHSANTTVDEVNHTFPIHIIDTDYDTYSIAYECRYNKEIETRHDYLWINARSRNLVVDLRAKIDEILKSKSYIDTQKIIWLHHTDEYCNTKHS